MGRYIDGDDRTQSVLFPERLDDWVEEDNPVRVVDVFVDALDLAQLGFERAHPAETGRPAYHPALLKIYVYGYLNRIQSSRRLEREAQRNVELIWRTGRLMPDFKTIADFRRDNGEAIRRVCREFVLLCRQLQLFGDATIAGSAVEGHWGVLIAWPLPLIISRALGGPKPRRTGGVAEDWPGSYSCALTPNWRG